MWPDWLKTLLRNGSSGLLRALVAPGILLGGLVAAALVYNTATHKVHVEPIRVPQALIEKGYTREIITEQILDAIESHRLEALQFSAQIEEAGRKSGRRWLVIGGVPNQGQGTSLKHAGLEPLLDVSVADLAIPQTDMTVGSVARVLRQIIGLSLVDVRGEVVCPERPIPVECTIDNSILTLRYVEDPGRFGGHGIRSFSAPLPLEAVEPSQPPQPFRKQVEKVAAQFVGLIDPAYSQREGDRALDDYIATLPHPKQVRYYHALGTYFASRAKSDKAIDAANISKAFDALEKGIQIGESEQDYGRRADLVAPLYVDRGALSYYFRNDPNVAVNGPDTAVRAARADFARAARSDDSRPLAMALRAYSFLRDGRFDLARTDYGEATHADEPEIAAAALRGLGLLDLIDGRNHSAQTEFDAANRIFPITASLTAAGIAHMTSHSYHAAAKDFTAAFDRTDGDRPYAALLRYTAETMAGDPQARTRLDLILMENDEPWFHTLADALLGRRPDQDVLDEAIREDGRGSGGKMCEASFYLGLKYLIAAHGDSKQAAMAAPLFKRTIATDAYHYIEWPAAAAFLRQMGAALPTPVDKAGAILAADSVLP